MYLAIDIGNSLVKIGIFENGILKIHNSFKVSDFKKEIELLIQKYDLKYAIISSVGKLSTSDQSFLSHTISCIELNNKTPLPFTNLYSTPDTLGVDRIALAAAVINEFPNTNVLVIDSGTCLTYDFVNEKSQYLGGAISPGLLSRYKSLKDYTANLPFLDKKIAPHFIGNNTENSIHSGVVNGIIQEINGVIKQYQNYCEKLTIVLTGGDAEFLAEQFKSSIFVRPYFLLEGLYSILKINKI